MADKNASKQQFDESKLSIEGLGEDEFGDEIVELQNVIITDDDVIEPVTDKPKTHHQMTTSNIKKNDEPGKTKGTKGRQPGFSPNTKWLQQIADLERERDAYKKRIDELEQQVHTLSRVNINNLSNDALKSKQDVLEPNPVSKPEDVKLISELRQKISELNTEHANLLSNIAALETKNSVLIGKFNENNDIIVEQKNQIDYLAALNTKKQTPEVIPQHSQEQPKSITRLDDGSFIKLMHNKFSNAGYEISSTDIKEIIKIVMNGIVELV